jgi:multiple sugar transport system substrate-binding protein
MNETTRRAAVGRRAALTGTLTGALAGALALTACGRGAAGTPPGQPARESGTIRVLNANWGDLYDDLMKKIGDEFTAETGLSVEWDFPPTAADEKLMTMSAAGDAPDASYTSWATQGTLASRGVLSGLDDYLKRSGLGPKDFNPAMYDASLYQGKLYALPGGADWLANIWNKTAYAEVGLDPERPPRTFAELEQHSDRLTKPGPDGYSRIGFWPGNAGPSFVYLAYLFGGELYDQAANKITANHPKVVEALEWLVRYGKKLDYNTVTGFWKDQPSYSKAGSPFSQGKAAYLFTGFWAYDPLDKYAAELKYGIAPWATPTGSPGEQSRNLIQGWMYAVPKAAKQPERGWRFVKYAFVDNSAKMGYLTLNGPCYLKQLDEFNKQMVGQVLKGDNRMTPYFKVFTDIARTGAKHFPALPITSAYNKALGTAYTDAMQGAKTPKAALDEVTQLMQAEVDRLPKS